MRFSPKALIFTRAWWAAGVGLGTWALMKREEIGPLPPLMSAMGVSGGSFVRGLWIVVDGGTYRLLSCTQACWISFCKLLGNQLVRLGFWMRLKADCFVPWAMSSTRMRDDVEVEVGKGFQSGYPVDFVVFISGPRNTAFA